ncbi:hypothetical protein GCM10009676_12920 [Prauserella halophila]|uniref:Zinc finger protein n=1 Tax=Prauserella halophila TaxID=185641 RepID=A0ABP4GND1_9PSEU|nr:hypothetical protein [Prauserella halophila]MCP2236490.1 hypothetical protein [Prauserella halophila]
MWTQHADGGLVTIGPDGWPIEADLDTPDFDTVPGWRPVAEGVRHIGGTHDEPPAGVTAEMLCGRLVTVPRRLRRREPVLFDCSACWHVWLGVD